MPSGDKGWAVPGVFRFTGVVRPKPIARRENVTVDILFYEVGNAREDM